MKNKKEKVIKKILKIYKNIPLWQANKIKIKIKTGNLNKILSKSNFKSHLPE